MNVFLIKLTTGEDIIADIENNNKDLILKQPAIVMLHPQHGLIMMEWMPLSEDKEYYIKEEFIVTTSKPKADVFNVYNEKFGNGLVVTNNSIVLPG